jgi:hypothetical protein
MRPAPLIAAVKSRCLRRVVCDIAGVVFYASCRTERGLANPPDDPSSLPRAGPEIGLQQVKKHPSSGVGAASGANGLAAPQDGEFRSGAPARRDAWRADDVAGLSTHRAAAADFDTCGRPVEVR